MMKLQSDARGIILATSDMSQAIHIYIEIAVATRHQIWTLYRVTISYHVPSSCYTLLLPPSGTAIDFIRARFSHILASTLFLTRGRRAVEYEGKICLGNISISKTLDILRRNQSPVPPYNKVIHLLYLVRVFENVWNGVVEPFRVGDCVCTREHRWWGEGKSDLERILSV